jgi:hypothetical protein
MWLMIRKRRKADALLSARWVPLPAFAVLLTCLIFGCSEQNGPILYDVSGKATRNGQPVTNLRIHFAPEQGRESTAILDSAGGFVIQYGRNRDGALPGKHLVWCERPPKSPQEELDMQSGKFVMPPEIQAILDKYGSAEVTPLSVDIAIDGQSVELKFD